MATALAVVSFERETALPEDRVINTFHFRNEPAGVITPADGAAMITALDEFYNEIVVGVGGPISAMLNASISRAAGDATVTIYGAPESPLGAPVFAGSITLDAAGSASRLPAEVALVLSAHGALAGDATDRRKRGRTYLGPFVANAGGNSERPLQSDIDIITGAASRMMDTAAAQGTPWVVYSRIGNASTDVVGGWVDNEWDTQRRRGRAATSRSVWS